MEAKNQFLLLTEHVTRNKIVISAKHIITCEYLGDGETAITFKANFDEDMDRKLFTTSVTETPEEIYELLIK